MMVSICDLTLGNIKMWLLGKIKLENAGSHIYKKKQEIKKMRMADAQAAHAEKMAKGELEYSGKLLEARQSDSLKDESLKIFNCFNITNCLLVVLLMAVDKDFR